MTDCLYFHNSRLRRISAGPFVSCSSPVLLRTLSLSLIWNITYTSVSFAHAHPCFIFVLRACMQGLKGSGNLLPGYDLGSFWAASGMTTAWHNDQDGRYAVYPMGFGDSSSGALLLQGVLLALRERLTTGKGKFVGASLLHAGLWCMSTALVDQPSGAVDDSKDGEVTKQGTDGDAAADSTNLDTYTNKLANNNPFWRHYTAKDGQQFMLLGQGVEDILSLKLINWLTSLSSSSVDSASAYAKLSSVSFLSGEVTYATAAANTELQAWTAALSEAYSTLNYEDILHAMKAHKIPVVAIEDSANTMVVQEDASFLNPDLCLEHAKVFEFIDQKSLDIQGIPCYASMPMDFSECPGPAHEFKTHPHSASSTIHHKAPALGAHNDDYLQNGFTAVPAHQRIKKAEVFDNEPGYELVTKEEKEKAHEFIVVEMSGAGMSVSSACALLAESGAKVYKIEPTQYKALAIDTSDSKAVNGYDMRETLRGGMLWKHYHPKMYQQLNRNKTLLSLDIDNSADDKQQLIELLSRANVLATNISLDELERLGVSYADVAKINAALVYTHVTPFGRTAPRELSTAGDLGAFYAASGYADYFRGSTDGRASQTLPLPLQAGELISSFFVASGISAGVFHQMRFGKGQLVELNLLRCATWCNQTTQTCTTYDPEKLDLFCLDSSDQRNIFPVPTANSFLTKDGVWIQLLGVDLGRHLHKTLSALGIAGKVYRRLVSPLVSKMLLGSGSVLLRALHLMRVMNAGIEKAVGKLTYAECEQLFKEKDVWYVTINTPSMAAKAVYAWEAGCFENSAMNGGQLLVTSPLMSRR